MPVAEVVELADTIVERSALSFESTDRDEGRALIAEMMRANTSGLRTDRDGPFSVRADGLPLGHLVVSRVRFASAVGASAPPLDGNYLIPFAVMGRGLMNSGGREVMTGPGMGCLLGSYRDVQAEMSENYDHVLLTVPATHLESIAARISGTNPSGRTRLPLVRQYVPPGFFRLLTGALQLAAGADSRGDHIEAVLLESLLLAGAGPLGLEPPVERVRARDVLRRAQEFMLADISRPPALTAVAAHCGVSVRTIQNAFRTVLHTTPTAWLRRERLSRARAMLLARNPAYVTVTDVAIAHGFVHLGDFASQFAAEYGVTPSRLGARDRFPAS